MRCARSSHSTDCLKRQSADLSKQQATLDGQGRALEQQTEKLDSTNRKVTEVFEKLEHVLSSFNNDFIPRLNRMSATVFEGSRERLAGEQIAAGLARVEALARGEKLSPLHQSSRPSPLPEPAMPPHRRFKSMEVEWSTFVALFRDRVVKANIDWDGRAIGTMAYQLSTDGWLAHERGHLN